MKLGLSRDLDEIIERVNFYFDRFWGILFCEGPKIGAFFF